MVTDNGIKTYVCSEKVHSGCTTEDQCTWVAISRLMLVGLDEVCTRLVEGVNKVKAGRFG